jgi:sugar/nucleoside kinase (ribokinase family)
MIANDIDMSQIFIHPTLPTGTTYIHDTIAEERGGIAYFPNANNDFDFGYFRKAVDKLEPKIVYYMYSGLSERGDANGGKDLAEFISWCRDKGIVTIVDSHTLAGNPQELIDSGKPVVEYKLLEPLLPEVDLFFASSDEAKMIGNTLSSPRNWHEFSEHENNQYFLNFLSKKFWQQSHRTRMFGVTVSSGAYEKHISPDGSISGPSKVESKFMAGEVIDLVGAGDSFRAGLISYVAKNIANFKSARINFTEAVQMGNLFASLYIRAPLNDRYGNIKAYEQMLKVVRSDKECQNFEALLELLN